MNGILIKRNKNFYKELVNIYTFTNPFKVSLLTFPESVYTLGFLYAKEIILQDSMDLFIGTVHHFSYKNYDKTRFLLCNGQKVKKADYPKLYAKIGDLYSKDNSVAPTQDEFVIPNYVYEFLRGGNESNLGTKQQDAMQKIYGTIGEIYDTNAYATGVFSRVNLPNRRSSNSAEKDGSQYIFDSSRLVRTDSETRPRNRKILYTILAK